MNKNNNELLEEEKNELIEAFKIFDDSNDNELEP